MVKRAQTGDLLGRIFDRRYRVNELIGSGGMGSVYRATHLEMNREVALKVLEHGVADTDKQVQRFYQEARASSKLQHPNTIRVFDFGRAEDGRLYLAMEYLRGETLTELLRRVRRMDTQRICRVLRQVCKSLAEAHQAGIVHRDLKPDNIFITDIFGEKDFVKVLDFGIAKSTEGEEQESLTQTGFICGTPRYLSPEQAMGKPIDARSDLYSLGVILYEMLTGKPPFVAATPIALVMKHIHEPPPRLGDSADPQTLWLGTLAYALMQKHPDGRPDSSAVVAGALDAIARGEDPRSVLAKTPAATAPPRTSTLQGRPRPTSAVVPGKPTELVAPRTMMLDSSEMSGPAQDAEPEATRMMTAMPALDEPEGLSLAEEPQTDPADEPTRMGVAAMPDPVGGADDEPTRMGVAAMSDPGRGTPDDEPTRMSVAAMPDPVDPNRPFVRTGRNSGLVRREPSGRSPSRVGRRPTAARSLTSVPARSASTPGRPVQPSAPVEERTRAMAAVVDEEEAHPMTRVMRSPLEDAAPIPVGEVGKSGKLARWIIAAVLVIGVGVGVVLWKVVWSTPAPGSGGKTTAADDRAVNTGDDTGTDQAGSSAQAESEGDPPKGETDPIAELAADPGRARPGTEKAAAAVAAPGDGEKAEAGGAALPAENAPGADANVAAETDSEPKADGAADTGSEGAAKPALAVAEFAEVADLREQWGRRAETELATAVRRGPEPTPVAAASTEAKVPRVKPRKTTKRPKPRKRPRPKKKKGGGGGFDVF